MKVHNTKTGYTKFLEVEHPFLSQVAVAGRGRGEAYVIDGHPQIQKVVLELLKLDIVYHIVVGEGYMLISVSKPHRWDEVEGQMQHIVARHLP